MLHVILKRHKNKYKVGTMLLIVEKLYSALQSNAVNQKHWNWPRERENIPQDLKVPIKLPYLN